MVDPRAFDIITRTHLRPLFARMFGCPFPSLPPLREQSTFSRVLPCSTAKNMKELQRLANDFHAGIERSVRDDYRGERQMEGL